MKSKLALLLISVLFCVVSCQTQNSINNNFEIIPNPQLFELKGLSELSSTDINSAYSPSNIQLPVLGKLLKGIELTDIETKAQIKFDIDKELEVKSEGYLLKISESLISIIGKDEAGLFYAFQTIEQLLEDSKEQKINLPNCKIKDEPKLSYRAIHLDIKHHTEKYEYYFDLFDNLAKYKVNAVIVEMEDKLKYIRQPEVGSKDAFSIEEWINLSNYAKERNIKISPLIQGLGHASFILKHNKYKELRDDPKRDWAFNPLNPKTYNVQFDLYLDAIEATPHGKYLHIGGDEVHTTGRNSGKSALELQLIWLDKVCKFAEEHGRTPIFWDDMPLKHADVYKPMFDLSYTQKQVDSIWNKNQHKLVEFLDRFPKNCIYMRWNYSNSQAIGNQKAMEWFRDNGLKSMGATAGQTRWVLMPQNESNMNNIRAFAKSSIASNSEGLLLTLWDDDSPHFELYKRGIIAFAEFTWSGSTRSNEEFKSAYRQREFSNSLKNDNFAFIEQLEKPVGFWKNVLLKGNKRNSLRRMKDPKNEAVIDLPNKDEKGAWTKNNADRINEAERYLKSCDSISTKIDLMKSKTSRNLYTLEVYEQVNKLIQFTFNSILLLKDYDNSSVANEKNIREQLHSLSDDFNLLRKEFENVYSKTRVLNKPKGYILDHDYHKHLANQSINFDWQFYAELLFLEKVKINL